MIDRGIDILAYVFLTFMATVMMLGCGSERADEDSPAMSSSSNDVGLSERESDLLDQLDVATEALDRLWGQAMGPNGEPPDSGFFRAYHLRHEVFALVLDGGLESFLTNYSAGPTLDESIAACEQAGAKGWAEMLKASRDVVFNEVVPAGEAYDAWLSENYVLNDELKIALSKIESDVLYADPGRAEEMPLLQIAAALRSGITEVEDAIEDKTLFDSWVEDEYSRFDRGVSFPETSKPE